MNGKIVKATDRQVTAPVTFLNTLRRDFHFQWKKREREYMNIPPSRCNGTPTHKSNTG